MADDTQYAYAVGRVRMLETHLTGKAFLERLLACPDAVSAASAMTEAGYPAPERGDGGAAGGQSGAVHAYIRTLDACAAQAVRYVRDFAPEPELFDIFLLPYDYANAKIVLKNEQNDRISEESLSEYGTVPRKTLLRAIRERSFAALPQAMADAIPDAIACIWEQRSARDADLRMDRAYWADCRRIARGASSRAVRSFLQAYLDLRADWSNLVMLLRARQRGLTAETLEKAYIDGPLPCAFFRDALACPADGLADCLRDTAYGAALGRIVWENGDADCAAQAARQAADAETVFLKENRREVFGIGALLAYVVARQREIQNARVILLGKLNGLPADRIREKLRQPGA